MGLLMILGTPKPAIVEDFMRTKKANQADLLRAMHGLVHEKGGIKTYFEGLDLDAIRAHLSWTGGQALISQLFNQAKLDGAVSTCTSLLRTCQHWLTIKPDDARICLATASALARL